MNVSRMNGVDPDRWKKDAMIRVCEGIKVISSMTANDRVIIVCYLMPIFVYALEVEGFLQSTLILIVEKRPNHSEKLKTRV